MKLGKLPLLVKVLMAMGLGIVFALYLPPWCVRVTNTLADVFSQLLKFVVPLVIIGLVTPAIAETGERAGKLLLVTVLVAYVSSVCSGFFIYGMGSFVFPRIVTTMPENLGQGIELAPYFKLAIPPIADVMTALVLSFVLGLAIPATGSRSMQQLFVELRQVVMRTLEVMIIPLLPAYIFCIFADMTASGKVGPIMTVFAKVFLFNFTISVIVLLVQYTLAGIVARRNPLVALWRMLPAYATALGTSSSAATIPVTLRQTKANDVSPATADFVIPLCATVHLAGSMLQITSCALALFLMHGTVPSVGMMSGFILLLGVVMVAAPGVPGGAIMSAYGLLLSALGFSEAMAGLMITLYIAADSFGTACNVTGDGAIAIAIDRWSRPDSRT